MRCSLQISYISLLDAKCSLMLLKFCSCSVHSDAGYLQTQLAQH